MNFYDRPQTLLEAQRYSGFRTTHEKKRASISNSRRRWIFFRKFLVMALTVVLLGFSAEIFAQSIKLGYAALSAGQIAVWMAKEGGYLSKYGVEADLIYIPAVAATQALIVGEIQLAQVNAGFYFWGYLGRG
jgi:hypothetical protein